MGNRKSAIGNRHGRGAVLCALAWALFAAALGGCGSGWGLSRPQATTQPVPAPIELLLPRSINFQGFTGGPRALDPSGQAKGIEVHIAAKDAFGDATKAFGDFRFELYDFRKNSSDPKGERLASWEVSTVDQRSNRDHWNEVHRMYEFRLGWNQAVPVGNKLVLVAVYSSPFLGERLFAQHVFVAGE
jgi:hypothetical protein